MDMYDAILIGANNSNLICALKLLKNRKKVLILEKNSLPGGGATSFIRGRFEFDASLQQLLEYGNKDEPGNLYQLFQDLGLIDRIHFVPVDSAIHILESDKKENYLLPFGIRNFIDKMEEYVPDSRSSIENFFNLAKECKNALKYIEKRKDDIRYEVLLGEFPQFIKIANNSVNSVLNAINMPKRAQELLTATWMDFGSPSDTLSFAHFAATFYDYISKGIVIPKKTSHEISLALAEEIMKNDGEIKYLSTVESIIVEDNVAKGIKLSNGEKYYAEHIISGISPTNVYGKMISSKLVPKNALKLTNSRVIGARGFTIYLGLNQSAKDIGLEDYQYIILHTLNSKKEYERMGSIDEDNCKVVVINNAYLNASPRGTCILQFTSFFAGNVFEKMVTPENYFELKEKIANHLINHFEDATGIEIKQYIEEIEIATPVTFANFTGHPNGTIFGYKATGLDNILPRILNSPNENYIKNLNFTGAFGPTLNIYASTYLSGNQVARDILKLEKGEDENNE